MIEYDWPRPPGSPDKPVWSGREFRLGRHATRILSFGAERSGWTDELTSFHEDTAGPDHYIDRASRQYAVDQLTRHLRGDGPIVLEVGCSSGFLLRSLRQSFPHALVVGADCVRGPLEQLARELEGVPLLEFDLVKCPLPDGSLDAVVMLNVLEHIEDDRAAMAQVYRVLKPGGLAVIEVPAGPELYDVYDKVLLHRRRYALAGLLSLAESARLRALRASHLGFFVYPAFWLVKQRAKRFLRAAEAVQRRVVAEKIHRTRKNVLLGLLMRAELALGRWVSYPIGIRCVMTCVK